MYKTLHKKQGSVTVQLRFARSSVTFCAPRDNNRGKYERDIRMFQATGYERLTCVYMDVVGLHEVLAHERARKDS